MNARNVLCAAVLCVLCGVQPTRASARPPDDDDNGGGGGRLPGHTEPVSYDVRLWPMADGGGQPDCTFRGRVTVAVRARRYADRVVLNARDLTVSSVSGLRDARTDRTVPVAGYAVHARRQRLVIELAERLVPTRVYGFAVEFNGTMRDDFVGFHRHRYDYNDRSKCVRVARGS